MDLLEKIREIGNFFQAEAGTYVFHEGDPCQNFLILEEGCIKVFKISEKGQELVLYRVDTDNLCTLSTSCVVDDLTCAPTLPGAGVILHTRNRVSKFLSNSLL